MLDLQELLSCTRCALSETRNRVVVGSGESSAPLMIIGEAPGKNEDEGGAPFIGRSGRLLFQLLDDELGLTRADCYVTNVVKCRPPQNRTPRSIEIATCRPWLDEQLRDATPRVLLVLGNIAARSVLGFDQGITLTHGEVTHVGAIPALATFHPAAALRGGSSVVDVMRHDLGLLRPFLETP